jgi:hypothetical protein
VAVLLLWKVDLRAHRQKVAVLEVYSANDPRHAGSLLPD